MPIRKVSFENPHFTGTEAARMPNGTTAQRANAESGDLRFNTTIGKLEQYDGTGWRAIDSPPVISSISPTTILDTDTAYQITITGDNFSTAVVVDAIAQDGSTVSANQVTRNSSTELVATFNGTSFTNAQEPYSLKVTNNTGLAITLAGQLNVNASPAWSTAAGSIVDSFEGSSVSTTVTATDPEGGSVTYSVTTNSLPTGISLNTSTGAITGTLPSVSADTLTSVGISASDGTNTAVERTFTINNKNSALYGAATFGFNNNGTNSGTDTSISLDSIGGPTYQTATKKYGTHALAFDGNNDWAKIAGMDANQQTFSFGYWLYWRGANPAGRSYQLDWRVNNASDGYFLIDGSGGGSNWAWKQSNGTEWQFNAGTLTTNTWYHLVLTSDNANTQMRVYLNGSLAASNNSYAAKRSASTVATLMTYYGAPGNSGNYFTDGIVDNFFYIDGVVLTATQAAGIYNGTNHNTDM